MNLSPSGVPAGLPPTLAERPVDDEYGLPIPFVYAYDDGTHDFGAINRRRSIQCALSRLCGMCGTSLEYDIAFLGGPKAAESRSYTDPPMHVGCAEAALQLCPHLHRHSTPRGERPATSPRAGAGCVAASPRSTCSPATGRRSGCCT